MNHLVIGMGEIGNAVYELIGTNSSDTLYSFDSKDGERVDIPRDLSVMHICFPFSDNFVKQVKEYIVQYEPRHIIIWSTVAIGTTRLLKHNVVHTPVEGRHPKLLRSLQIMHRWLGSTSLAELKFFGDYFQKLGLRPRKIPHPETTEALKLLSTTKYGINLVFADYMNQVLTEVGGDYELSKQWDKDYNELYRALKMPQFQKYVLDPPGGRIGGHCVRENAMILQEDYDDDILDLIVGMKGANDE